MISPLTLAKERLSIIDAWRLCKLAGNPKIGKNHSPFRQDSKPSFSIFADGKRWKDFGTGESGSVVDFVGLAQGLSVKDACEAVIRLAGTGSTQTTSSNYPAPKLSTAKRTAHPWSSVETVWNEGHAWLAGNSETQERMAKWRGWPVHWIEKLVESGMLACPLHQGNRCTAFLVVEPMADGAVRIGYHARLRDGSWRFAPSGIKANPFWFGDLASPRLIITEGQWDAITLAGSAGWLDRHESWPEDVAVIGIRGASGTDAFIDLMAGTMRQTRPEILIIRDGDEAGERWRSRFAPNLKQHANGLRLFRMSNAKDLNDAYKTNPLTSQDVWAILGGKTK